MFANSFDVGKKQERVEVNLDAKGRLYLVENFGH